MATTTLQLVKNQAYHTADFVCRGTARLYQGTVNIPNRIVQLVKGQPTGQNNTPPRPLKDRLLQGIKDPGFTGSLGAILCGTGIGLATVAAVILATTPGISVPLVIILAIGCLLMAVSGIPLGCASAVLLPQLRDHIKRKLGLDADSAE